MIELVLVESYAMDTVDGCTNPGLCCFSCPAFDSCDHHYEDPQD